MERRFSVGVIGVGRMGSLHLKKLGELATRLDFSVSGIYDPRTGERPKEFAAFRRFDTVEEALFESDALIIASPTHTHHSLAKQALSAGCHVLIEKPVCETIEQAQELSALVSDRGLVLQVGFLERFRLRKLLGEVNLPSVRMMTAQRLSESVGREPNVDVVSDLMIHDLDLVLSLQNEDPIQVEASGVSVVTETIDAAIVKLLFANGSTATLSASRISLHGRREMFLASDGVSLSLDFKSNEVAMLSKGRASKQMLSVDPLSDELVDFVDCCRLRRAPVVPVADAIRSMRLRDRIVDEIRYQTPFSIPFTSEVETTGVVE